MWHHRYSIMCAREWVAFSLGAHCVEDGSVCACVFSPHRRGRRATVEERERGLTGGHTLYLCSVYMGDIWEEEGG